MEKEEKQKQHIYSALVAAQRYARAVLKDSKNDYHRYKYASAEDIIQESRDALAENGLAFIPRSYVLAPATESSEAVLKAEYLLVHTSGECEPVYSETPVIPEKGRPADKATATAKTYDLSYTLRGLLMLPRVDHSEMQVDQRDDRDHEPKKPQTVQPEMRVDERWTIALQKLTALAKMFGAEQCRKIVGKSMTMMRTAEDLEHAIELLLEAQAASVLVQVPTEDASNPAPAAKQEHDSEVSTPDGDRPVPPETSSGKRGVAGAKARLQLRNGGRQ